MNETSSIIFTKEKIIIQQSNYIEDGCYIEIVGGSISLYEIPYGGGEPIKIENYSMLIEAYNAANLLT